MTNLYSMGQLFIALKRVQHRVPRVVVFSLGEVDLKGRTVEGLAAISCRIQHSFDVGHLSNFASQKRVIASNFWTA